MYDVLIIGGGAAGLTAALSASGQGARALVLEAAPRVAGTMGLTRNLGANLPLMTLFDRWGYDLDLLLNEHAQLLLDRAFISRFSSDLHYQKVYVDYDDTLTINGKVNGELMRFLYQARDAGKELILLSRSHQDLMADMRRRAICEGLFDQIIWLKEGEAKPDFIEGDAIFIDDSFAERRRVRDACHIPVFDVDMVESLLDWRS